jgi:hypothetical protein
MPQIAPPTVNHKLYLAWRRINLGCVRSAALPVAHELEATAAAASGVALDGLSDQSNVAQEIAVVAATPGVQLDGPPAWTLDQIAGMAFGVRR